MKTLCWDTSTAVSAVALTHDGEAVARDVRAGETRHGEVLLPRVMDLLAEAGWHKQDIELLVVGIGPGSFTGLRVGLATAKGWALSTGLPIVGVSSPAGVAGPLLDAGHGTVAVVTDAFKGEVYLSVFEGAGGPGEAPSLLAVDPHNATPRAAAERLLERVPEGPIALAGDGLRRYPEVWEEILGSRARALPATADVPCPVALSRIAAVQYKQSGPCDLATLEPMYVRGSDAKLPKAPLSL